MSDQIKSVYDDRRTAKEKLEDMKHTALSFDEIRKDLDALQSDVANLATDVKKAGVDRANGVISYVNKNVDSLKATGTEAVKKVEDQIQAKPGQSVIIAFVTGILASYLFSRRS
jgi:ElaB/YqjD/DUF883 family membrane-anchored ribosome-binding protein